MHRVLRGLKVMLALQEQLELQEHKVPQVLRVLSVHKEPQER